MGYITFIFHELGGWFHYLSLRRHAIWRHHRVLVHKKDPPKQAAIGRATLSFCKLQQQWRRQRQAIYRAMARLIDQRASAYNAFTHVC